MGLELLKEPEGINGQVVDAGMFTLPPEFDTKLHAAEWVDEGQVEMKKQRQHLPQTGLTADGWEVFKKSGKPVTVSLSKGRKFFLMFRPRSIQDQVNAAYGNVSKELLRREVRGESLTSVGPDGKTRQVQDPGMLTESRLKSEIGGMSETSEGDTQPNKVEITRSDVTAAQET
jgi:hypothetical protein